ncbi:MAG: endonuclease III [Deltaproteobacteria bacterium]|nr:endonuclease III [Deltaproteobacteria bacterium]
MATSSRRKASSSFHERRQRALAMARILKGLFPQATVPLRHQSNWELFVAVVLSAQATDKKVNEVTDLLFQKYKTLGDYINADQAEFEQDIKKIGLYRSKARHILASARIIQQSYGGELPRTMAEMLKLPGAGRKSANVVLGKAYGAVEGIAVDTHVRRFAIRFDLTDFTDPFRIEQDLMALLPTEEWFGFSYRLIMYGRQICPARQHECRGHPLTALYPPAAKRWFSASQRRRG